jgi:predicted transcriptional regulator
MERLCALYFELSNEERLKTMQMLNDQPLSFTGISEGLDINSQQCSRHLTRMLEADLIAKNPDGSYSLSAYGRLMLKLTQSMEFASRYRDYFVSHDLSRLPYEFVARIGDLSDCRFTSNVMVSISEFESIIEEAEDHLWVIINKRTRSVRPFVAQAIRRGISLRSISPTSYVPDLDVKREISEDDELAIVRAEDEGRVMVSDADQFDVYMWASEKTALICFPMNDGSFDYTGFISRNERAIGFCEDLFNHYWRRANVLSRREVVERHLAYLEHYGVHSKYR